MMTKQTTTAAKTSQTNSHGHKSGDAAGSSTVAQTPPTYGIDLVDSAPVQKVPLGNEHSTGVKAPPANKQPHNGLPDNLKAGIESLSGYAMDDVKVHYNSSKPAQLQAHAYAQGTDIHLAPGQERHLPHEAWHVVQQKQGRVKPTRQLKGKMNINDNVGLEKEADVMGGKALQTPDKGGQQKGNISGVSTGETSPIYQRIPWDEEQKAEIEYDVKQEAARKMGRFWRSKAAKKAASRLKEEIQGRNAQFGLNWDNIVFNPTGVGEEGWAEFRERQTTNYQGNRRRATYNRMASKYGPGGNAQDQEGWIKGMILSGSTLPNEKKVKKGTTFVKLIKIDDARTLKDNYSPYYIHQGQFFHLMQGHVNMEQKLGLPTTSHGAFYKVYFLTAVRDTTVFQSTIAPTEQYKKDELEAAQDRTEVQGFETEGGAQQTLILDSQNPAIWKMDSKPPLVLNSARVLSTMKRVWLLSDFAREHADEQIEGLPASGGSQRRPMSRAARKMIMNLRSEDDDIKRGY